ncbi:MAG: OmpA family protein [Bacteroidetes bacterium]|nr:OmpA family protein [Bacteroidota bacterium]
MMGLRVLMVLLTTLCNYTLFGQCKTITANETCGTGTGKTCKKTQKSSYGGKMELELRSGEWTFLNENGVIFKKGSYLEQGDFSNKSGDWQWIDENGKSFLKVRYENDIPVKIIALDSGIATCGDDSAWVFMPDSVHWTMRFSLKGLHQQWNMNQPGEWQDYKKTVVTKKAFKPSVGIVGKNDTRTEVEVKEIKPDIIWTDEEILEIFPGIKSYQIAPMSDIHNPENLIGNPTFYHKKTIQTSGLPLNSGSFENWDPGLQTPDVFSEDGKVVLGFRVAGLNFETVRNTLRMPLSSGKYYCFSVQIKLKKSCNYAVNRVGVLVDKVPSYRCSLGNLTETESGNFLLAPDSVPFCLRDTWMTLEGRFQAKGGEQYVYFGQFSTSETLRSWPLDSIYGTVNAEIYYLFRNAILIQADKEDMCICNLSDCPKQEHEEITEKEDEDNIEKIEKELPEINPVKVDSFVLESVQFETAKWQLLPSAYAALDSLAEYLTFNDDYTLEITGHTDNQGSFKDNQILSEKRAKTVMDYLKKKGVSGKRMTFKGKGDTEPVDDNGYEEGRESNRRVEFKISKPNH